MPKEKASLWRAMTQGGATSLGFVLLSVALLAGGASRGAFVPHGVIEASGAILLAIGLVAGRLERLSASGWIGLALLLGAVAWGLIQLAPLPGDLWSRLPGRAAFKDAMASLGVAPMAAPISLFPEATRAALYGFLPIIAAFTLTATTNLKAHLRVLAWLVASLAAASVLLGVAQVITGPSSQLYFYNPTGWGAPVGLFANQNHQATLCLMALPLLAAKAGDIRVTWGTGDLDHGRVLILVSALIVAGLGVIIAGSVAGYTLLGPVAVASFLVFRGSRSERGGLFVPVAAIGVLGILGWLAATSPVLKDLGIMSTSEGYLSRPDTFSRTMDAIAAYFPVGSGLGTFEQVYPRFEDPAAVTTVFMNHAHNDYLEVAMELGIIGMALLVAAIVFWAVLSWRAWTTRGSEARLQKAASIALAVPLLHSLVDYPLRTPGLAVLAAVCAGVLVATTHKPQITREENHGPAHKQVTL